MRKCFRYAGCVAFNFYETGDFDICELFSKIVPTRENITGHKVTRGFFSDTCGDIDNFTDYRFVTDVNNSCHPCQQLFLDYHVMLVSFSRRKH